MKRTKRQENGIIIYVSFYTILLLGLVIFMYGYMYPKITEIETKKSLTASLYQEMSDMKMAGISYEDFLEVHHEKKNETFMSELLKNIEKDFFVENLKNESGEDFLIYLNKKGLDLKSGENNAKILQKEEEIIQLLPQYSENNIRLNDETLNDFKFINYVESILATFGLSSSDPIGVRELVLVEGFSNDEKGKEGLNTNIFYIPLNLSLKGSKENIIKFLHFVENVGSITLDEEGEISIHKDPFLSKHGSQMVLAGKKGNANYNIYENQIIDIESFKLPDYLDTYVNKNTTGAGFKDFVIATQGNDKTTFDIRLRFYVKGLPFYKIEESINSFIAMNTVTTQLVNNELKSNNTSYGNKITYTEINNYLKPNGDVIKELRKELVKKEDMESVYKKSVKLDAILYSIHLKIGLDKIATLVTNKFEQKKGLLEGKGTDSNSKEYLKFLTNLEPEIMELNPKPDEKADSYMKRINTKKYYDSIKYLNYQLDLRK